MSGLSNDLRRDAGEAAVLACCSSTGDALESLGHESAATETIANVLHWLLADAIDNDEPIDLDAVCRMALNHVDEERDS